MNTSAIEIKKNIARSKNYATKGELLKSLTAAKDAVKDMATAKLAGRQRMEVDILVNEMLHHLNQLPKIQKYLNDRLEYQKGQPKKLFVALFELAKKIEQDFERQKQLEQKELEERKYELIDTALDAMDEEDPIRAVRMLRKLAAEYPDDITSLISVAEMLLSLNHGADAVEILNQAIAVNPSDRRPYTLLVKAYTDIEEFQKAEDVYKTALKRFGGHAVTYLNMSNMYLKWKKWDQAYDAAKKTLELDPDLDEAKKIMDSVGKKIFSRK